MNFRSRYRYIFAQSSSSSGFEVQSPTWSSAPCVVTVTVVTVVVVVLQAVYQLTLYTVAYFVPTAFPLEILVPPITLFCPPFKQMCVFEHELKFADPATKTSTRFIESRGTTSTIYSRMALQTPSMTLYVSNLEPKTKKPGTPQFQKPLSFELMMCRVTISVVCLVHTIWQDVGHLSAI